MLDVFIKVPTLDAVQNLFRSFFKGLFILVRERTRDSVPTRVGLGAEGEDLQVGFLLSTELDRPPSQDPEPRP